MITKCETEAVVSQDQENPTCELTGGFERRVESSGKFEVVALLANPR